MYRSLLLLFVGLFALPAAAQSALFTPADDARATLAPRQAELLGHLEAIPAAAETQVVRAHLDRLDAPVVEVALLGDAATLALDRVERRASDASYFLRGTDAATFAVLVLREGQLTGSVRLAGQLYAVRPLTGGLHAVARMAEERFVDHAPEWAAVEAEAAERWAERLPAPVREPAPEGGTILQRVLVPYTPNAEAQVGDILALVQLAIDETNMGYERSDIAHRVVLAHTYRTPQNASSSFSTTLDRMQNPNDGYHDEIPGLRAQYGGDLVNMIAGQNGGLCGQARTILADGPDEGFAVSAQNCATGYYTFGHELGHLQGARHNTEIDGNNSPFPYGHGKCYDPGNWRTVMSYGCPGSTTRVLQWSNPDVDYLGTPTGDVTRRDNARVLDETAGDMAAFYPDPASGTATVAISGPSTIGSDGGVVEFTITVSNASGAAFAGEYWALATLPNGNPYNNDVVSPTAIALDDGQSQTVTYFRNVPRRAPAGIYTVTAYAGQSYPNDFDDSDSFQLTKAAAREGGASDVAALWSPVEAAPLAAPVAASAEAGPSLLDLYPNPMDARATVRYAVGAAGTVRVSVYDVLGREVAVLADGTHGAGTHAVGFDAQGLPSGVYVVRVRTEGAVATQRVTLAR
ncbi:MAG: zinc-dependent metalloprotease [Rubricoccaceae bacterium]|nr:zinc-dependent metalloprotease [Rubricoccaceae bacterium]